MGPSSPAVQPLPTAPALDPYQLEQRDKKAAQDALAMVGGGRASTMLTAGGGLGDPGDANSVVKRLLGGI